MAIFYVTATNELRAVEDDSSKDVAIPQAGSVFQVTNTDNDSDEQVWVLSTDPDTDPAIGGDLLKVCVMNTKTTPWFKDFVLPGGKKFGARSIAAGKSSCYFVEEDGSVHRVDKDGNHKQVFPANTAIQIQKGWNGLLIIQSYDIDVEKGGNLIKWFMDEEMPSLQGGNEKVAASLCAGQMQGISILRPKGSFYCFDPAVAPVGDIDIKGIPLRLISNVYQYLAITDAIHPDGGNLIQNISDYQFATIKTTAGAVYAEGTSLNISLFQAS